MLKEFYSDHVLTDFDLSLNRLKSEEGNVLPGVQFLPYHGYIEELSGIHGWISLHVVPWLPLLGRQVQRDMHFVRFGNFYVKKGYEAE